MASQTVRSALRTLVGMVCVGALAFTTVALAGSSRVPPAAPIIAVVELDEVLKNLHERKDKEDALSVQFKDLQQRLSKMEEDIKADEERLKAQPDGPNKITVAKALRERYIRLEFEKQYSQKLLDEARADNLRELYLKICKAATELAQAAGYSMVLASDEKAQIPRGDPEGVLRAITLRRMLFVDKSLDITDELVKKMNNDYAVDGSKPAATPAPAPATTPPATKPAAPQPAKPGTR